MLSSDFDALISQWTEDFVVISPSAVVRVRGANATLMEGARAMAAQFEPVEHVLNFEETIVAGDYAFLWGTFRSSSRWRASGEVFFVPPILRVDCGCQGFRPEEPLHY